MSAFAVFLHTLICSELLSIGSSRHTSRSASNLLSTSLNTTGYVNGRRQSSSGTGYNTGRRTTSSVGSVQSPMSVMSSTPKSGTPGLHTPRSAVRTNKPQTPTSEPRSTSLHMPRLRNPASKSNATVNNGLSLAVREPTNSLPSSPHSSDPDSLDEPGNLVFHPLLTASFHFQLISTDRNLI